MTCTQESLAQAGSEKVVIPRECRHPQRMSSPPETQNTTNIIRERSIGVYSLDVTKVTLHG